MNALSALDDGRHVLGIAHEVVERREAREDEGGRLARILGDELAGGDPVLDDRGTAGTSRSTIRPESRSWTAAFPGRWSASSSSRS